MSSKFVKRKLKALNGELSNHCVYDFVHMYYKYTVNFSKIVTPEFSRNADKLRTYSTDLRSIMQANSLKDTDDDA